jgi:ornithine cyclodeaminase/alanine dehydrogenase-like protein (mu-crystallin family)
VPEIPVLDHQAVLAAVDLATAIEAVHDGFVRFHRGEWAMPPKIYLDSPPFGDFRAMPARSAEVALMKWITSFPGNSARGLPVVTGLVCLSDARTGEVLMLLDGGSVTAVRTGAVAAVASRALARPDARTVGQIGCGSTGGWVARSMAAAGYGPGVCADPNAAAAQALATELGWLAGDRREALACDVACCVTPGSEVVVDAGDLHPGLHLNMMGADSAAKAEASVGAVASCVLFCDEWEQAAHGGELAGAVRAGLVGRGQVTELAPVLAGEAPGRPGPEAVTMFDSTGLAIQDLAVAALLLGAWRQGRAPAQTVLL